jgi:hypothetical protein
MDPDCLKPLSIYEDRYRGNFPAEGVFLIYPHNGNDVLRMEPINYACNPNALRERVLCASNAEIGAPLAGGTYCLAAFDFSLMYVPEAEIPQIFRRLFATIDAEQAAWFEKYLDAQVLLRSERTPHGSIRALRASFQAG